MESDSRYNGESSFRQRGRKQDDADVIFQEGIFIISFFWSFIKDENLIQIDRFHLLLILLKQMKSKKTITNDRESFICF